MSWRWHDGHLLMSTDAGLWMTDRHRCAGAVVFGPDADATCLAMGLISAWQAAGGTVGRLFVTGPLAAELDPQVIRAGHAPPDAVESEVGEEHDEDLGELDLGGDGEVLTLWLGTGWAWLGLDAPALDERPTPPPDLLTEVGEATCDAWRAAWTHELGPERVSQGAFVSEQQYEHSLAARLGPWARRDGTGQLRHPPREDDGHGRRADGGWVRLEPIGTVLSWTRLIAAGAPSEFALRAELHDGVRCAVLELEHGVRGVHMFTDDTEGDPLIGEVVGLCVRRLYAMEGRMRHGLKAWRLPDAPLA